MYRNDIVTWQSSTCDNTNPSSIAGVMFQTITVESEIRNVEMSYFTPFSACFVGTVKKYSLNTV